MASFLCLSSSLKASSRLVILIASPHIHSAPVFRCYVPSRIDSTVYQLWFGYVKWIGLAPCCIADCQTPARQYPSVRCIFVGLRGYRYHVSSSRSTSPEALVLWSETRLVSPRFYQVYVDIFRVVCSSCFGFVARESVIHPAADSASTTVAVQRFSCRTNAPVMVRVKDKIFR